MSELENIKQEIQYYETKITEYMNGTVDPDIKAIRAIKGVYAEREMERYMTRLKNPAGVVSVEQLEVISAIADKYSHGRIHFTTRQDIQFHGVELQNTVKIMNEALEVGINTLGAGGNSARNVACSPLSGVDKNEVFDVTPYAIEVSGFLLKDPSTRKLPRKYKIAFSNTNSDTAYATIADLGFVAKIVNGKKGFELYGAGGLGGSPTTSLKLEDFIEEKDVLYYVQGMKELFEAEGDRQNRNKARIRYIVYRLGEERFRELFNTYVAKVKSESNLDLHVLQQDKEYAIVSSKPVSSSPLLIEQKQPGYYALYVHPEDGYITTKNLNKVLNFLKGLGYEASIRLANTQGFYIRDVKGADADLLLEIVSEFAMKYQIDSILHCVGATVCGIGLCNSKGLSTKIRDRFSNTSDEIKSALPKVYISGCTNSCGQHQIGKIGFSGKALKGDEGMVPAYRVFFGGAIGANKTKLGEAKGDIAAKKIPEFLYRLALLVADLQYEDFDRFIKAEWTKVEALIKEFEILENNPEFYYDFDSQERFLTKK